MMTETVMRDPLVGYTYDNLEVRGDYSLKFSVGVERCGGFTFGFEDLQFNRTIDDRKRPYLILWFAMWRIQVGYLFG